MSDLEFWGYVLVIGSILTYICWGFVFAIQGLLLLHGRPEAVAWLRKRYRIRGFMRELVAFAPMLFIFHFLLEVIPKFIGLDDAVIKFSISDLIERAEDALS
ncbi:hypothetical protein [Hydrogenimonas cancrithermarum]|uniref:Uncharacterized protein n=1 Tax=Hydrogenimonas cancrithermarum TaxID=2993563 RepID=A0ABM8FI91_9BACT|nr:hypothetical protein [Hydrogenimonas cancrithermarum]BDY11999.1 hypothetical protein HCR_03110 [Hydrogenimonas cancrithermarum]